MSPSRRASQPDGPEPRAGARGAGAEPFGPGRVLLRDYALAWLERALRGTVLRASGPEDPLEAVFLDPFAGADHPLPASATPISVTVLQRLFAPAGAEPSRARAFLLEEDPVKLEWLRDACGRSGLEGRAERWAGEDPPAEVALVEGGWEAGAAAWSGTGRAGAALGLLDPPNAGRLPLDRVLDLLRWQPEMDVLLRFPVADLRRVAGFRGTPLADLPPYARRAAEGISRLLGDRRHDWALTWRTRQSDQGDAAAELAVVEALAGRLRTDGDRLVRVERVELSAGAEYFLLLSADPSRVLLMNEVLFASRNAGRLPWTDGEREFVRYVPRAELELFGGSARSAPGEARDRSVDVPALAHALATRFAGRRVSLRAVLESVLPSELFLEDVRRALSELRRDGRALFRSLAQPLSEITFPRLGSARPHTPARQRRRGEAADDLLLALDGDTE